VALCLFLIDCNLKGIGPGKMSVHGIVKWFDDRKGFGFKSLNEGAQVNFDI